MSKEYMIVDLEDYEEFIKMVNDLLQNGWELVGGVSIAMVGFSPVGVRVDPNMRYCQALIKQLKEELKEVV